MQGAGLVMPAIAELPNKITLTLQQTKYLSARIILILRDNHVTDVNAVYSVLGLCGVKRAITQKLLAQVSQNPAQLVRNFELEMKVRGVWGQVARLLFAWLLRCLVCIARLNI